MLSKFDPLFLPLTFSMKNNTLKKLLKPYIFRKLEILSLIIFKTDFSIDNLEAVAVDLKNYVLGSILHLFHRRVHLVKSQTDRQKAIPLLYFIYHTLLSYC